MENHPKSARLGDHCCATCFASSTDCWYSLLAASLEATKDLLHSAISNQRVWQDQAGLLRQSKTKLEA